MVTAVNNVIRQKKTKLKLIYVFNVGIISQKASVVQAINMCDAFASQGVDVELAIPAGNRKFDLPHDYLSARFGISKRLNLSFYSKIMLFNRLGILGSYFGIKKFLAKSSADVYFTRCPMIFTILANNKLPVIYESHNAVIHNNIKLFDRYWSKRVIDASRLKNCLAFITISKRLGDHWSKKGVPSQKILVLHDGFNTELFEDNIPKSKARSELGLPEASKILTYSGSLYPDRDIENLIKLAEHFNKEQFIVIGGPRENSNHYQSLAEKRSITNINFMGPVDHSKVPLYLYASDVLLALWSERVPTINYCSPLKIFEYMAAGRSIVAHGFPTVKEVITHNKNGFLARPGNFNDLIEKTYLALNTSDKSIEKKARSEAFEKYTWNIRASEILGAIGNI